jgi:TM2 domain-containing membrane protein YozV
MPPLSRQFAGLRRFLKRVRLWNIAVMLYVFLSWAGIFAICVLFRQVVLMVLR